MTARNSNLPCDPEVPCSHYDDGQLCDVHWIPSMVVERSAKNFQQVIGLNEQDARWMALMVFIDANH